MDTKVPMCLAVCSIDTEFNGEKKMETSKQASLKDRRFPMKREHSISTMILAPK